MAQELAKQAGRELAEAMLSLPVWIASRVGSLGTVRTPDGQATNYLSHGLRDLSDAERREIDTRLKLIAEKLTPGRDDDKAKLALIARMLMAYPTGGASETTAEIRGEAYLFAVDDIPAWMVDAAIKTWLRGETGALEGMPANVIDYRWAPAPPVLRQACLKVLRPYREVERKLILLRDAKRLDEVLRASERPRYSHAAE